MSSTLISVLLFSSCLKRVMMCPFFGLEQALCTCESVSQQTFTNRPLVDTMAAPVRFTPFYGEENLAEKAKKYLLDAAEQNWELDQTDLSDRDQMRGWKPLDTMLGLFCIGRIGKKDADRWKTLTDDVAYHRMLKNTHLCGVITQVSKKMSWLLRHGDEDSQVKEKPTDILVEDFLSNSSSIR